MYYALYRKYRPLTFRDVIGQEAVTSTLRRQVASGQISHAYLFTGTRGTGKTSCAKILARAVNCRNPHDGDPCNECDICRGLLDGSLYDVEEIDAASNNGVENIRQIREEVVYAPAAANYKVYIIDEVHMLSPGAFNALLKTLEEPPAHAIFILATTEIHKVPATILSRCQRFDFLRLSKKELIGQFRDVLEKEGKTMDDRSLDLVAELADGSSRDGLSVLDKVIDLSSFEEVESVLGVIPKKRIYDLLSAAAEQDTDTLYRAVEDMYNASADLGRLCARMMDVMKDLMIFRSAKQPEEILEKNESDAAALKALSEKFPTERILYSLNVLQQTVALLPRSPDKRTDAEVCMLRLARPDVAPSAEDLSARLATLEQTVTQMKNEGIRIAKSLSQAEKPQEAEPKETPPENADAPFKPENVTEAKENTPKAPVFEDPFADPSVASAGKYVIPEEAAEPIRPTAPKAETPPRTVTPPPRRMKNDPLDRTFVPGWQRLSAWADVAATVSRQDRILGFLLESCPAVYNEKAIIVIAEDREDYDELRSPQCMQLMQQALKENRKEGYTLRVEHCAADKYIPDATMEQIRSSDLFDFGDPSDDEM